MPYIKCPVCHKDVHASSSICPYCSTTLGDSQSSESTQYYNFFDSSSDDILAHIRERSKTEPSDHDAALPRQGSASRAAVYPPRMTSKVKKLPPPGRKLWGYRSGNPLLMLLSVFYYMASAVILLKGLQISPQYQEAGTLAYHYGRLISGGLMLYLPALLLSETPFRRFIPLFNSRRMGTALIGFVVLYVPLAAIFLLSWYCCM